MNCPVCGERLREVENQNVSMEVCPGCQRAWVDPIFLERMMAAATSTASGVRGTIATDSFYREYSVLYSREGGRNFYDDGD